MWLEAFNWYHGLIGASKVKDVHVIESQYINCVIIRVWLLVMQRYIQVYLIMVGSSIVGNEISQANIVKKFV